MQARSRPGRWAPTPRKAIGRWTPDGQVAAPDLRRVVPEKKGAGGAWPPAPGGPRGPGSMRPYGFAARMASTIACSCCAVSALREPIPPLLLPMAAWMSATLRVETGIRLIALIGPWQLPQFAA